MTATTSELVFIPSPRVPHLPYTIQLASLLLQRHQRLSATIIIMQLPSSIGSDYNMQSTHPRLRFAHIPCDDATTALITPQTFTWDILQHHKPRIRDIVRGILTESDSVRLAAFVAEMYCIDIMDVAKEFGVPTYTYFLSPAATLGLMFFLQAKRDNEGFHALIQLENSAEPFTVPGFVNPVSVNKVLPDIAFHKGEGWSKLYLDLAKKYRESNGVIVNTFHDLESYGLESLASSISPVPVFPVGPVLDLVKKKKKKIGEEKEEEEEIMRWLNEQPESSVVFLCFGTMGTLSEKQVKEMAVGIERSTHRFMWALRRPPPKGKMEYPRPYENLEEVLPEGFLERTSSVGKVIGWAPQMAVLSHPSVGGFVSHCGWNSTLESIWCGVPMAAWPVYSKEQVNAFLLGVELGLAAEIKMEDTSTRAVTAEEIEEGIRKVMSDGEMRKKMKKMKQKCRAAVVEGGSSYVSVGNLIDHLLKY